MNIFYLDDNIGTCAQYHCDKHVVKMILEYAQLLSTAHRILDGEEIIVLNKAGRRQKTYKLPDERENILYKATHANHPSAVWARQSVGNYVWLYNLFLALCKEYTYRYGKVHKTESLKEHLSMLPNNLTAGGWSQPTPAMPDEYIVEGDSLQSYRNYYAGDKVEMSVWTDRPSPSFMPAPTPVFSLSDSDLDIDKSLI